jgi:hypothetical protein
VYQKDALFSSPLKNKIRREGLQEGVVYLKALRSRELQPLTSTLEQLRSKTDFVLHPPTSSLTANSRKLQDSGKQTLAHLLVRNAWHLRPAFFLYRLKKKNPCFPTLHRDRSPQMLREMEPCYIAINPWVLRCSKIEARGRRPGFFPFFFLVLVGDLTVHGE